MSNFKTESVNHQPTVLLIAADGPLTSALRRLMAAKGLEVVQTEAAAVSRQPELQNKLFEGGFYRVIWVLELNSPSISLIDSTIDLLQQVKQQTTVVIKTLTQIKNIDCVFKSWSTRSEQLAAAANLIIDRGCYQKLFILKDVVELEKTFEPLLSIVKFYKQGLLINPLTSVNIQPMSSAAEALEKEFFRPGSVELLVSGKEISTSFLCQKIQELSAAYYHKKPNIIKHVVEPASTLDFSALKQINPEFNLEELIDSLVRVLPQISYQPTQQEKQALGLSSTLLKTEVEREPVIQNESKSKSAQQATAQPNSKDKLSGVENKIEFNTEGKKAASSQKQKNQIKSDTAADEQPGPKTLNQTQKNTSEGAVDEEISRIFKEHRVDKKVDRRVKKASLFSKIKRKILKKKAVFAVGLALFLFGVVVGGNFGLLLINRNFAKAELVKLMKLEQQLKTSSSYRETASQLASTPKRLVLLQKQTKINEQLAPISPVAESQTLLSAYRACRSYLQELAAYYQTTAELSGSVWFDSPADTPSLIEQHSQKTQDIYQQSALVQAELENTQVVGFSPDQQKQIETFQENLGKTRKKTAQNQKLSSALPTVLGLNRQKTYWVVLQDNQELRPTGGFIQALGKVVLDKGMIVDQQTFTTEQINNRLAGSVSAPAEVTRYLGEDILWLRDANWDPDFPTSAQRITWFITESLNQPVDGLLAVNYYFIQDLLEVVGPVSLDEYQEKVDHKNLFERLRQHAIEEKESAEQNFHTVLLRAVFTKLAAAGQQQKLQAAQLLGSSLDNGQSLLTHADQEAQTTFETLGWVGSIILPNCPAKFDQGSGCGLSSIYQVESNVGVNKVNPFVSRKVNHLANITSSKVLHTRTIVYQNQAYTDTWPMGVYKNYLRFYLDLDAENISLAIDGKKIDENRFNIYEQHKRQVVGVYAEVPAQDERVIELSYSTPANLQEKESFLHFDQHQPGVKYQERNVRIQYDASSLSPALIAPKAELKDNVIVFSDLDKGHAYLGVRFSVN